MRPLDIVIPFYRNAVLAEHLAGSLAAVRDELAQAGCSVILVNDSPGDIALAKVLAGIPARLGSIPVGRIENQRNLGFVRSANAGMRLAVGRGHDVLLLNSDTVVFPGAIAEMRRIAGIDPMIGFVNPRSNNAPICSLPDLPRFHKLPRDQAHAAFTRISGLLPEYQYVPTAVGFCLLIKFEILAEFGLLDEAYDAGYNEENDLVMRANHCGFRAALANRAYVYHVGEASFQLAGGKQQLEHRNAELLEARYPEYLRGVARYSESARYQAELLLPALIPGGGGRQDLVFDCSIFRPYHAGTFTAGMRVLEHAARHWRDRFHLYVLVSPEAMRFHGLDRLRGIDCLPPETARTFAVALRVSQPFHPEDMARLSRMAVVNVYTMLDPIALDCLYIGEQDLETLWSDVFSYADGVVYISDFVRDQFHRRFRCRPELKELVSYLSLDLRDYAPDVKPPAGDSILVVGNTFHHKHVAPTVEALRAAFPQEKIAVLGIEESASGTLPENRVNRLFECAKVVVYPSFYEGFGLPVLEALARSKPVLARDLPATRAIRERLAAEDNLLLYGDTSELIDCLRAGFPVWNDSGRLRRQYPENNWEAVAGRLRNFMEGLVDNVSVEEALIPRIEHFRRLKLDRSTNVMPSRFSEGLVELAALQRRVRDRERQITDLHNSLSWRITAPLRVAYEVLLRRKTR